MGRKQQEKQLLNPDYEHNPPSGLQLTHANFYLSNQLINNKHVLISTHNCITSTEKGLNENKYLHIISISWSVKNINHIHHTLKELSSDMIGTEQKVEFFNFYIKLKYTLFGEGAF